MKQWAQNSGMDLTLQTLLKSCRMCGGIRLRAVLVRRSRSLRASSAWRVTPSSKTISFRFLLAIWGNMAPIRMNCVIVIQFQSVRHTSNKLYTNGLTPEISMMFITLQQGLCRMVKDSMMYVVTVVTISKVEHSSTKFLGELAENLLLDEINKLQAVAQGFIRVEDPLGVHFQQLLLVLLHHLREQQRRRTQSQRAQQSLLALGDEGEGVLLWDVPIVIPDGEGEFVEADAAVAGLLAAEEDEFFVPSVKEAVHLDVEYFPTQLPSVNATARQVLLPLLHVTHHPLTQTPLTTHPLHLLPCIHHQGMGAVHPHTELPDSLVAHLLPDYELILPNLLVRVVVIVVLGEVNSHAPQQFSRQRTDLLVQLGVQHFLPREIRLEEGQKSKSFLISDRLWPQEVAAIHESLCEGRSHHQLPRCLPRHHSQQPLTQGFMEGRRSCR